MKFYLAATYNRNPEMRMYRDILTAKGHEVTSRWIDQHDGVAKEAAVTKELNESPEEYLVFATHDIEDIERADALVCFTGGEAGRGGKHVEFGYALGRGKRIVLIESLVNVFHTLPEVRHFPDWNSFEEWL